MATIIIKTINPTTSFANLAVGDYFCEASEDGSVESIYRKIINVNEYTGLTDDESTETESVNPDLTPDGTEGMEATVNQVAVSDDPTNLDTGDAIENTYYNALAIGEDNEILTKFAATDLVYPISGLSITVTLSNESGSQDANEGDAEPIE